MKYIEIFNMYTYSADVNVWIAIKPSTQKKKHNCKCANICNIGMFCFYFNLYKKITNLDYFTDFISLVIVTDLGIAKMTQNPEMS